MVRSFIKVFASMRTSELEVSSEFSSKNTLSFLVGITPADAPPELVDQ